MVVPPAALCAADAHTRADMDGARHHATTAARGSTHPPALRACAVQVGFAALMMYMKKKKASKTVAPA